MFHSNDFIGQVGIANVEMHIINKVKQTVDCVEIACAKSLEFVTIQPYISTSNLKEN